MRTIFVLTAAAAVAPFFVNWSSTKNECEQALFEVSESPLDNSAVLRADEICKAHMRAGEQLEKVLIPQGK